jgi:hypothetical protein
MLLSHTDGDQVHGVEEADQAGQVDLETCKKVSAFNQMEETRILELKSSIDLILTLMLEDKIALESVLKYQM